MYNVQTRGIAHPNVVVGMALFCGGLAQFLAGMWEFPSGNTFGATGECLLLDSSRAYTKGPLFHTQTCVVLPPVYLSLLLYGDITNPNLSASAKPSLSLTADPRIPHLLDSSMTTRVQLC